MDLKNGDGNRYDRKLPVCDINSIFYFLICFTYMLMKMLNLKDSVLFKIALLGKRIKHNTFAEAFGGIMG